jgi:hypothetical protein
MNLERERLRSQENGERERCQGTVYLDLTLLIPLEPYPSSSPPFSEEGWGRSPEKGSEKGPEKGPKKGLEKGSRKGPEKGSKGGKREKIKGFGYTDIEVSEIL